MRAPTQPLPARQAPLQVEQIAVELPALRTTVSGFRAPAQDAQTIRPDAKMLFVAGAGWTKKQPDGQMHAAEAGELILGFLRLTGASLGSSKSLVDQGGEGEPVLPFLTHMNQIGQTGATPRHAKGLSTCCHGEEPHVVGWRFIGDRRAISLDPNCGWTRGKADVVYVADAFQVMAKVNALLEAAKKLCTSRSLTTRLGYQIPGLIGVRALRPTLSQMRARKGTGLGPSPCVPLDRMAVPKFSERAGSERRLHDLLHGALVVGDRVEKLLLEFVALGIEAQRLPADCAAVPSPPARER